MIKKMCVCVSIQEVYLYFFLANTVMTKGGMEWLEDRVEGLRERSDSGGDKAKGEGWWLTVV